MYASVVTKMHLGPSPDPLAQWLGPPHKLFFVFVFFWSWGGRTSLLSYLYYFVSVFVVIKTMKMTKIDQFRT